MDIDWKDRTDGKTVNVPINCELPVTDNLKIIANWINEYKQKYDIRYVVMCHAAKKNAPVLEQGFLAGNSRRKTFGMNKIEALDAKRQSLIKAIADMSAEAVAPEHIKRISGFLDNWENISFEDRWLVLGGLVSTIQATSENCRITWKI